MQATISEQLGTRYLHLGTPWVQGAMQIRKPNKLVLEYVQRMMAWLLFVPSHQWHGEQGQCVQLGLGAAALTKYCYRVLNARTTAVELSADVLFAAHQWFDLPVPNQADDRLKLHLADAGAWIAVHARPQSISALMVDLYDHEAQSPVLDTPEFYAHCRRALQPGGAMAVNLFYGGAFGVNYFERSLQHLCAAFRDEGAVWAFEPTREGNTIVIAVNDTCTFVDAATLKLRAASVASNTDLPARQWVKQMHRVL